MKIEEINRLLIIRLSSLGDILLTTPVVRSIKKQHPSIEIDFLIRKEYKDTLSYNPYISNLFFYENEKEKLKPLTAKLMERKYDLVADLQNNLRSRSMISFLNRPAIRFKKHNLDKFLLVNCKINRLKECTPITTRYAQVFDNLRLDDEGLEIHWPGENNIEPESKREIIGLCPGSRHFTKMWPKGYFIELGNLLADSGREIWLIGGRSDRAICSEIAKSIRGSVDCSYDDEMLKMAGLLKKCKAVVCNDSGLMHLTCAVGTPVFALFGSTVKEFGFSPYKNRNLIFENNSLSCRPCSHIGRDNCPKGHFKCMKELTPSLVYKKLELFIEL